MRPTVARMPTRYNSRMDKPTSDRPEASFRSLLQGDYPAVKEIIAASFIQAVQSNPKALDLLEQEPWYDTAHMSVAEVDGEVVSCMGVRTGSLSFSGVGIPAGLVGTVCTAPRLRGRGIGSMLMWAAIEKMQQSGLILSYLHTSEDRAGFYSRLGYRKAISENPLLLLSLDGYGSMSGPESIPVHPGSGADAEDCHRIYDAFYGRINGSWSRTLAFWERRLQGRPKLFGPGAMSFRLVGRRPALAYVAFLESPDAGTVSEWACLPGQEDAAMQLLHSLLRDWRDRGIESARLQISSRHALRPLLRDTGVEDATGHGEVWLRCHDSSRCLDLIRPVLAERASVAGLEARIRVRDSSTTLNVGRGEPLQLEADASDLCCLIYNGRRLPGLIGEGSITASDCEKMALLFPETGATRCAQDAY